MGTAKIVPVIRKRDPDATTGQNALNQVEIFQKIADVGAGDDQLDGTAKGGMLVALADRFGLRSTRSGWAKAASTTSRPSIPTSSAKSWPNG